MQIFEEQYGQSPAYRGGVFLQGWSHPDEWLFQE